MKTATKTQQRILDFIEKELQLGRPAPTHREIAGFFGFKSTRAAACHLEALKKKGLLESEPGKARALRIIAPLQKFRSAVMDIPLFGSIPAGLGENREQEAEACLSVDVDTLGFKPGKNTFALRVAGHSMTGKHVCDGDIVILEHGPEPRDGQMVAALIDGASTLKTFVVQNGKSYLKAENPKYPDLIPVEELMVQGVFKALIRRTQA
jgi:repressor LexA